MIRSLRWIAGLCVLLLGCGQTAAPAGSGPASELSVDLSPAVSSSGDATGSSMSEEVSASGGSMDAGAGRGVGPDATGPTAEDGNEALPDTLPGPGEFGAPCELPGDCFSEWCVLGPEGKLCSRSCLEECPAGWRCEVVQDADGEPASICIHITATLCHPCRDNKDCNQVVSNTPNACVSYGAEGHFCGLTCEPQGSDCPQGYQCEERLGLGEAVSWQCVPSAGMCACNGSAQDLGLSTDCELVNDYGACAGSRFCGPDGLTPCGGNAPQAELCNAFDDDCDGELDEEIVAGSCEISNDYGTCAGTQACVAGEFLCVGSEAVEEQCNGADDDCDGTTDEGFEDTDLDGAADCVDDDDDNDGSLDSQDCAPLDSARHPGADEVCNAVDDDCDGLSDEQDALGCIEYFQDVDGDGWGASLVAGRCLCGPDEESFFTVDNNLDCNDGNDSVSPEALGEVCNGLDDDCNGQTDEGVGGQPCVIDNPGVGSCAGVVSCIDGGVTCLGQMPSPELCNGVDDNCDGDTDEGALDTDNDGLADCVDPDDDNDGSMDLDDCAPLNSEIYPGADERCGGGDDDCDGQTDEMGAIGCVAYYQDGDQDSYGSNVAPVQCLCGPDPTLFYTVQSGGDCADLDATVNPGVAESCNFIDDDCDGQTDEGVSSPCGACIPVCVFESGDGDDAAPLELDPENSSGLSQNPDGGLVLDASTFELPFIWIANSNEDTVSKLNTATGCEVARYQVCDNPSRTAVDLKGHGIITCRDDGRVAKIAVFEPDCKDLNGDGEVNTSRDANGDCVIDTNEMVDQDECVLWNVQPDGPDSSHCGSGAGRGCARAAGVDENNDVWVGFWLSRSLKKLDAETGEVVVDYPLSVRPYGLAIDADQNIWIASRDPHSLALATPEQGQVGEWGAPGAKLYGMAIDGYGKVWLARGEHGGALRFDPETDSWLEFEDFGFGNTRGVAVRLERDEQGVLVDSKVYLAHHSWSNCDQNGTHRYVSVIDGESLQAESPVDLGQDRGPVGVAIDNVGNLWTVNQCDSTATKIDAATKQPLASYPVGMGPYTYSDMTGYALKTITTSQGYIRQLFQGWVGSQTLWDQLIVKADTPGNGATWLTIRYRIAESVLALGEAEWVGPIGTFPPSTFPLEIDALGAVCEVEVVLHTDSPELSPTVHGITMIAWEQ